ncbi:zeta toxin family protein [Streptomyces achromogenes]
MRPVVVIVGGRPGAGKTKVADLIQAVLGQRGVAVRIGHDPLQGRPPPLHRGAGRRCPCRSREGLAGDHPPADRRRRVRPRPRTGCGRRVRPL